MNMKTLKCNAKSCVYNKSEACVKDSIVVGDGNPNNNEIKCESFMPTSAKSYAYEMAEEMENMHHNHMNYEQPHIDCMAEQCKYNERHNCTADNVKIDAKTMNKHGQTMCDTYSHK